ncbi:MAG: ribonuclease P protein component [Chitinispirillales bacterium]|nr:ribonuclease P protein component [Chitinispirillales bacterium]
MKKFSFGRRQKIKSKLEISQLFKEGQRWACLGFVLIYKQNGLQYDRLGVIVSRKIGNAVERNRAKRIFRELFRCNIGSNPPFFDILIKPRVAADFKNAIIQRENFKKWQEKVKISPRESYTP